MNTPQNVLPVGGASIGGVKNGGNVTIGSDGSMNVDIDGDAEYYSSNSFQAIGADVIESINKYCPSKVNASYIYGVAKLNNINARNISSSLDGITSPFLRCVDLDTATSTTKACTRKIEANTWVTYSPNNYIMRIDKVNKKIEDISETGKYYKIHNLNVGLSNVGVDIDKNWNVDVIVHNNQDKFSIALYYTGANLILYFSESSYIEEFDSDPGF